MKSQAKRIHMYGHQGSRINLDITYVAPLSFSLSTYVQHSYRTCIQGYGPPNTLNIHVSRHTDTQILVRVTYDINMLKLGEPLSHALSQKS